MFKRLLLATSLLIGAVALQAPTASASPLRTTVELAAGPSIAYAQYYYGPRRRYVRPRYYAPPRYYGRRYYGRPYYARRYYAPRVYYPPPVYYRPYPYYGRRGYYR